MIALLPGIAILLAACLAPMQDHHDNSVSDLLGILQREQLQTGKYNVWFEKNYDAYESDEEKLVELRQRLSGITMKAFFGTWCGDSKRQVPRLFSLLDEVGYGSQTVELIAINKDKEVPAEYGERLNIHHTPTFIIMRGGEELGRIIETPVVSLEQDLLTILRGEPYTPNHSARERAAGADH